MQDNDSERDRELDAVLATYAEIEPRPGLEQRVLANLRAEQRLHAARGLRQWTAPAALVLAVSIAVVSSIWLIRGKAFNPATGLGGTSRENVGNDTGPADAATSDVRKPGLDIGRMPARVQSIPHTKSAMANHLSAHESPQRAIAAEAAPRLEQFPAPEPLSDQEKLLVRFVEEDPQEAALVAQASAQQLEREDEEIKEFGREAERVQEDR